MPLSNGVVRKAVNPLDLGVALGATTIASHLDPTLPRSRAKQTAKRAVQILLEKDEGFHEPNRTERDALLIVFAHHRRVLYGAAFDVIRLKAPVDLNDPEAIAASIDDITVYEIKSTSRSDVGDDLAGYFFALTTAELLVSQSLAQQFRFAFVNTLNRTYQEMTLNDVFGRARGIYPTWSIRF